MTSPLDDDTDDMTRLVDCNFPTMALVGKGANGVPRFLISKEAESAGLMDPGFVRELIAKAPDPEPAPAARDDVTMTGSPGAIAAFIHKASEKAPATAMADAFARGLAADTSSVATRLQLDGADIAKAVQYEQVIKAKYSAEDRRKMAANGQAMDDESYPIADKDDLTKAVHAVGRGGSSHNAIRKHIIARAKSLGASSEIPDNWAADGSLKETSVSKAGSDTITKADGPEMDQGMDGLDPTVPLAAPDEMGPGDPMVPGSPAWESIDAATACKWMSIAARLKNALCTLAERELIEAAVADPSDASDAWDLQDAMCAVDYVIDTLACFAAGEKAEVDLAADTMAAIGKALASFDPAPLETVEGLAPIAKAGRVLSAANESAIRDAHDSLQKVLMSLPQAPAADDPITKEAAVAADQTSTEAPQAAPEGVAKAEAPALTPEAAAVVNGAPATQTVPVAAPQTPAAPVAKADGEAPRVVYDEAGKPLGIVMVENITAVQGAAPAMGTVAAEPDGDAPMDADKPADPAAPADAAVDPSAPADPCDMTPQPADDAGTKTDEVTKAGTEQTTTITHGELESIVAKAVTAALDARAPAEGVIKSDAAEALAVAKSLEDRLAIVEKQPAMPGVFVNGQTPPEGQLRGQNQGAPPVDIAKAAETRAAFRNAEPAEQNRMANEMQTAAIGQLAALHGRQ